ncbi:hypothetical protein NDU88_007017 [Pleurodeles waltl]|uniref:Uncharacterized protein n=1 Tax=Pleurodeles waltl TaxID=8319 RepID=A0AAV7QQL3_PLEWA|nr:hypothetical protein NDU88_007017 [Pleurodeles waltl]
MASTQASWTGFPQGSCRGKPAATAAMARSTDNQQQEARRQTTASVAKRLFAGNGRDKLKDKLTWELLQSGVLGTVTPEADRLLGAFVGQEAATHKFPSSIGLGCCISSNNVAKDAMAPAQVNIFFY